MNTEKIYEAVEEYRKEIGAKKLHVSLGPNATPENVVAELRKVHENMMEFDSVPEYFRDQWEIKKLRGMLHEIGQIALNGRHFDLSDHEAWKVMDEPTWKACNEIWGMTDLLPSHWPSECLAAYKKSIGEID